jgi:hypothetical protein
MSCSSCSAPPSAQASQKPVRAGLKVVEDGDEVVIIENGSSGNGSGLLIALVITIVIIIIVICVGIACNGSSQKCAYPAAVPVAQSVVSSVPSYGGLPTAQMPTMQGGGGSAISSMSSLSSMQ